MQKTHQGSLAVVQMRNDAVCALVVRVDGGAKAPHSSNLAWKIHGWRSLVGLQSMRSLRVGHN